MTQHARMLGAGGGGRRGRDPRLLRARIRARRLLLVLRPVHRLGPPPAGVAETRDSHLTRHELRLFGIENDGLNLAVNLLVFFLFVIYVALVYWTYADASRRLEDPLLIACATAAALFPFIGTIVYTIVRPPEYLEDAPRARARDQGGRGAPGAAREPHLPQLRRRGGAHVPALPVLHAQAEGAVPQLRQAARPALAGVPVLRVRGRRPPALAAARRARREQERADRRAQRGPGRGAEQRSQAAEPRRDDRPRRTAPETNSGRAPCRSAGTRADVTVSAERPKGASAPCRGP